MNGLLTLFKDGVPTKECLPQLAELSRPLNEASQLVNMAEEVSNAFVESIRMERFVDQRSGDNSLEEIYTQCGLREPYAVDNDPAIWKALGWMGLSVAQWTAIAKHWENGRLNHHAMNPPFSAFSDKSNAPIVMVVSPLKKTVLTVSRPPSHPLLTFQIGGGELDLNVWAKFDNMVKIKTENVRSYGGPHYARPILILIDGVAYYQDDCQWTNWEMKEVKMRTHRELNSRIFLQFLGDTLSGYYVPVY